MSSSHRPSIAVLGALKMEIAPLVDRLADRRSERWAAGALHRGRLGDQEVVVAAGGDGGSAARQSAAALLDGERPELLIGIGVAGGLTPDLKLGAVVAAERILDSTAAEIDPVAAPATDEAAGWHALALAGGGVVGGAVVTAPGIAGTPAAKAELYRLSGVTGPAVVDLESAGWAREARQRRVPLLVLRAVSDTAEQELPLDFNAFRTPDGRLSRGRIARHALARPALLRQLKEMGQQVETAAEVLADLVTALIGAAR